MNALRKKIDYRLNQLQDFMDNNIHLEDPQQVLELIKSITKFWSILEEGDRDYVESARFAVEFQKTWS